MRCGTVSAMEARKKTTRYRSKVPYGNEKNTQRSAALAFKPSDAASHYGPWKYFETDHSCDTLTGHLPSSLAFLSYFQLFRPSFSAQYRGNPSETRSIDPAIMLFPLKNTTVRSQPVPWFVFTAYNTTLHKTFYKRIYSMLSNVVQLVLYVRPLSGR